MGLETTTREIQGTKFQVTQLPFGQARKTLTLLVKRLGPGLVQAAAAGGTPTNLSYAGVAAGVQDMILRLEDEDLETLSATFGKSTRVVQGDATPVLDSAAQEHLFKGGELTKYFTWLAFCIEVNYADFFAVLRPLLDVGPSLPKAKE